MMIDQVDILLPTCNGEKFLSKQLDSLLFQTFSNWRLLIRDDLSSDETMSIIKKYKKQYPDRIYVVDNKSIKKGIVGSFECLLNMSASPYVAFCDQDDVWAADKLFVQMNEIKSLENKYGGSMPVLVHTDLTVVDNQLKLINASFWKYQHLNPYKMSTLRRLLVQNCVTGCTVMINRPLVKLMLPFPENVIMHDWWIALVAVSEGVVSFVNRPTVQYRQHDSNDTGAKRWGINLILKAILHGRQPLLKSLLSTRDQAAALLQVDLTDANICIIKRYILMYESNWFFRRVEMLRMRFFKYGVIRNIAMFLRI